MISLKEAIANDLLSEFVAQEEQREMHAADSSELSRALCLLVKAPRKGKQDVHRLAANASNRTRLQGRPSSLERR